MDNFKTVYTVSDLTHQIKLLIEENFPSLWVQGEVSNYKKHYSGHFYFTLKDSNSQISCVMWKSRTNSVPFELEDGMQIHIFGNISLYEKSGRYQLDAILIQQAGIGELQLKFEKLKQKLNEEGLFDDAHKKLLPKIPNKIGIITSPTGAAIKDIVSVIRRRFPVCEIILRGVKVQGEGASNEISQAIMQFNKMSDIDLLIIGRGGGSLEDLWAFNEEIVARAIYASKIPIISAVGHDIDYTISDLVADLRAPTPSVAAELAVPDKIELMTTILDLQNYLTSIITDFIQNSKNNIYNMLKSYAFRKPEDILHQYFQRLDDLIPKLLYLYSNSIKNLKTNVGNLNIRLLSLHPHNVLKRGYAIVQKENKIIKSINEVEIEDYLDVKLSDGNLISNVKEKKYD